MAILSSHTLNSVDGTHAGGVGISLIRIDANGERNPILTNETDSGGRFLQDLDLSEEDCTCTFELVLQSGAYFEIQSPKRDAIQILKEIVIRFEMPDPNGRYHIPLMLAPNSYSVWWSS